MGTRANDGLLALAMAVVCAAGGIYLLEQGGWRLCLGVLALGMIVGAACPIAATMLSPMISRDQEKRK